MTHWDGVRLAPRYWPGQARVKTLAATIKLMFGKDFEVITHPRGRKRTKAKYMELDEDTQKILYHRFKDFYDLHIQRTLK